MKMVTFGPTDPAAINSALTQAMTELGGKPKLGLVYMPVDIDHQSVLRELQSIASGAPVIGASTGGAAFTERGETRDGIVGGFISGEDFEADVALARVGENSVSGPVQEAVRSLPKTPGGSNTLLVLADAFACDGEVLLSSLRQSAPPHWRFIGGTAGDNWKFEGTKQFYNGEVISGGVILARLKTAKPLTMAVKHGWCSAEGAREFIITEISGNVLKKLDNRPAAQVYTEELERLGLLEKGEDPVKKLALYELGVKGLGSDELKIRAPLGIGEDGSIVLASSLLNGGVVRVVQAKPDTLIQAAGTLSEDIRKSFTQGGPNGALAFDCAARLQLLGQRYSEEVSELHGPGNHPMLGFACYGEIAKFGGDLEGFHNTTAVMGAW